MKIKYIFIIGIFILLSCEKSADPEILRFYGDAYEDIGYSVAKTGSGYAVAGQHQRLNRSGNDIKGSLKKLAVIITGADGNEVRKDTSSLNLASCGNKVITLNDGSLAVAGYVFNDNNVSNPQDIYLVVFAPDGEGYTEKVLEMPGTQYATDIIKTADGYLVLGTTDVERGAGDSGNARGKKDIFFIGVDNNLNIVSSLAYGYTGNDEGVAIKAGRPGEFVIVGTTDMYRATSGTDVLIASVNMNTTAVSSKIIQVPGDQKAADFEVTPEGYLIAGNTTAGGINHGFAYKITGNILGTVDSYDITFGKEFTINAICRYKTNSFLMAGQYGSVTSGSIFIFATDMLGKPVEGWKKIAGGTGNQVAYDVIADGEDIIAVGKNSYENNSMITLLKFRF
ncbi:MAG: hypothetical protein ACM3UT_10040 [Chloroflexota bacterium]